MGSELPKQFLLLNDKPILIHTLERFFAFDQNAQIIITLPKEWQEYWKALLREHQINIPHDLIDGGQERFHSIENALKYCKGDQIAIHDGVRPLVQLETISRCFDGLQHAKAVVPVLGLKDSLRKGSHTHSEHVDRKNYYLVHTPQCFDAQTLHKAYAKGFQAHFTDDASVVEALGFCPLLVPSNEENIKITSPLDLVISSVFLQQ